VNRTNNIAPYPIRNLLLWKRNLCAKSFNRHRYERWNFAACA